MDSSRQISRSKRQATGQTPTKSETRGSRSFEKVNRTDRERQVSIRKEQAPIIINKDEQFSYKAPSTIHETVVATLRKEKDNITTAL